VDGRLTRSRSDVVVAGVCGGLGRYLRIDPVLVRLFFVLLALGSGVGVLLYIVLWVVIPRQGAGEAATAETMRAAGEEVRQNLQQPNPNAGVAVGIGLIVLGALFLLKSLDLAWMRWLSFDMLWPLLLVAAGLALIWRQLKGG
jgi:phage shock protein C